MFDLEARIREWRRSLTGRLGQGDALDELESHLREEMHRAALAGREPETAWNDAVARLGPTDILAREFAKVPPARPLAWIPAWIVAISYLLFTPGLMCPMFAKMRFLDASPFLIMNAVTASIGYFAVFSFGTLTAMLALSRLWGGTTIRRVACLRWWGRAFAVVSFVGCLGALVSGSLWTKAEFGAYWQNDPVEIGGAAMVLWTGFAIARFLRQGTPSRLDLAFGLAGNVVLGLSWFVAVALASKISGSPRSLHSYGGLPTWWIAFMLTYFAIHLVLLGVSLAPLPRRASTSAETSL